MIKITLYNNNLEKTKIYGADMSKSRWDYLLDIVSKGYHQSATFVDTATGTYVSLSPAKIALIEVEEL